MESSHHPLLEDTIQLMNVQPRDRILEVGCGEGAVSRRLAMLVPEGLVVGLDVSDERIRNARAQSTVHENLLFLWTSAEEIPWQENFFSQALSVDSFCYFENPERALREIYRVLSPGGSLWILNSLSKEKEQSLCGLAPLQTPLRLFTAEEYESLFARCGYEQFTCRMLPHGEAQALLLSARKPRE